MEHGLYNAHTTHDLSGHVIFELLTSTNFTLASPTIA